MQHEDAAAERESVCGVRTNTAPANQLGSTLPHLYLHHCLGCHGGLRAFAGQQVLGLVALAGGRGEDVRRGEARVGQ